MSSAEPGAGRPSLRHLLQAAFQVGASDIHLKPGTAPMFRIDGDLRPVEFPPLERADLEQLCSELAGRTLGELRALGHFEFGVQLEAVGRLRGHCYWRLGEPALALRPIPLKVPGAAQLRLPAASKRLSELAQGLVLVTGATGMGKTTTLACLLDIIAHSRCCHIVTVEDPVEYVIADGQSFVTQREVGRDVKDFHEGLHSALRQDPDVIMIGEIRDRETMEVALHAALSGHLVLSSAHFMDTVATVNGVIGMADPREQHNWRFRLAQALRAIISQRLLPRRGAQGRVLATEVLVNEPAVRASILDEAKTKNIRACLERARAEYQTHTFDQCLLELLQGRLITLEVAQAAAASPGDLMREVTLRRIEGA
jgi:twitching motility protein PilT